MPSPRARPQHPARCLLAWKTPTLATALFSRYTTMAQTMTMGVVPRLDNQLKLKQHNKYSSINCKASATWGSVREVHVNGNEKINK